MDEQYLGDSYDLGKRLFAQVLGPIGRLYAHGKFVPPEIHDRYTKVTTIPIPTATVPEGGFGILLDPDTGVRLPTEASKGETIRHVSLEFITKFNKDLHPEYIICFDQSHHRKHELSRGEQRERKREFLRTHGMPSFYYESHAPFLFTSQRQETLRSVLDQLISAGIPQCRFKPNEILG